MHEVPFCFDFHVNKTTVKCPLGSKSFQATTNVSFGRHSKTHCKTGSLSPSLALETRDKCHDVGSFGRKPQEIFLERDGKVFFTVLALDALSLSILDRKKGRGKTQCSNLLHLGNGQLFALTAPDLRVSAFLMMYYNRSFVKPVFLLRMARPMRDGRPFASSPFRRMESRCSSFRGFHVWWAMQYLTRLRASQ